MARTLRHQIAHLLRRAGFGGTPEDLDTYAALGFEGAVDRLVNYSGADDSDADNTASLVRASAPDNPNQKHPEFGNPQLEVAIWLTRMLLTKRPLQEKMTLFWHGHFTSSIQDVKFADLMLKQNELFRANALTTDFKVMTKAVGRDPAMLLYLDNYTNKKGKPNENWARELMELFTLGIGNYTETDVKESARAFTGWTLDRNKQFVFNRRQHDTDPKTFLGHTGNFEGDDIIDLIFTQPVHAQFMARKLFRFFVYDDPEEAAVNRLADAYRKSNFSIKELVTQILVSPEFRSEKAYYALVKSPTEFVIGALKSLSARFTDLNAWKAINQQMAIMGQQLWLPPNVGGWPGNKTWVNSTTYYARANLAERLVDTTGDATVDPVEIASVQNLRTPQAAVDYFLEALVQSDVPADYRPTLLAYVGNMATSREQDAKLRGLVRLIMSSPVYQMN